MKNLHRTPRGIPVLASLAVALFLGDQAMAQKRAFADYFTFLHSRPTSGLSGTWQLYDIPDGPSDPNYYSKVRWSGDVYLTSDRKETSGSFLPLIDPYGTSDPDVIEYHVLSAIAAGLDGFLFEWVMTGQPQFPPSCQPNADGVRATNTIREFATYGQPFGFEVGVNWTCALTETYKGCYGAASRNTYLDQAAWDLDYLLDNIYSIAGIHVGGRPVVLLFTASACEPVPACDLETLSAFHPSDIQHLRSALLLQGHNPIFLTRATGALQLGMLPATDGFFAWKHTFLNTPVYFPWTQTTSVQDEVDFLAGFEADCAAYNVQHPTSPITYIMGALPRFDDHKGRAWGGGDKRYTPSTEATGNTLEQTLATWPGSESDLAFVVTWNDQEEATIIEPSREFGYENLDDCLTGIAAWKGLAPPALSDFERLRLPERLFRVRKAIDLVEEASSVASPSETLQDHLDDAIASAVAAAGKLGLLQAGALADLTAAEASIASALSLLHVERIDFTWTYTDGATNPAMQACGTVTPWPATPLSGQQGAQFSDGMPLVLDIKGTVATTMSAGAFVGRMTAEFVETNDGQASYADWLSVLVDAPSGQPNLSTIRKSKESGGWRELQFDLVNGRWSGDCASGGDIKFATRSSNPSAPAATTAVHHVRIEGFVYQVQ